MASTIIPTSIVTKVGVVIRAGKCGKTVKVRVQKTVQDKHIRKYLNHHDEFLAHDEREVCVEGDIVTVTPGRTSSTKRHLVTSIVSAINTPHARGAPESHSEWLSRREAEYNARRIRKLNGPNAERYMIKYEKDLPDLVKEIGARREKEAAAKKEEERVERERVLREEEEARERKRARAARKVEIEAERERKREEEARKREEEEAKKKEEEEGGVGGATVL